MGTSPTVAREMGFQLLVRDARTLTVDGLCAEDDAGTLIAAVERKAGVPCAKMWLHLRMGDAAPKSGFQHTLLRPLFSQPRA